MQQIFNNPYRILGILVGATAREQNRQANNLKKYIEAGQEPPVDYSFPVLGRLSNTIAAIDEATSKLNLDNDKMLAALFWFYKGNDITDEPAFEELKMGNTNSAMQIWEKLIIETKEDGNRHWKEVTERNHSAFHNWFIVAFLNKINGALIAKLKFLESEYYIELKRQATDETFKTTKKELQLKFLNIIVDEIEKRNINLSLAELVNRIKNENFSAQPDFLKIIAQKFTANITAQIEITRKQRTANKVNAAEAGEKLYNNTKNDLEKLKSIFGTENLSYSSISDKLSNEILQCGIDYFNCYKDSDIDPGTVAIDLAKKANTLVVGNITKQRCEENIKIIQEWIDDKPEREKQKKIKPYFDNLLKTLQLFESKAATITNAEILINQTKPDLNNIKSILGSNDSLYLKLSTRVAAQAQHYIIEVVNSAQENIKIKILINPYETIDNLKTILKNAWGTTLLIETLDMEYDFRVRRYIPNKDTLRGLCEQQGIITHWYNKKHLAEWLVDWMGWFGVVLIILLYPIFLVSSLLYYIIAWIAMTVNQRK